MKQTTALAKEKFSWVKMKIEVQPEIFENVYFAVLRAAVLAALPYE